MGWISKNVCVYDFVQPFKGRFGGCNYDSGVHGFHSMLEALKDLFLDDSEPQRGDLPATR